MSYNTKKFLIFSTKVSVGYVPYIGPLLSMAISEIQNNNDLSNLSAQIQELQSIIGKDIKNKIPIRSEIHSKFFPSDNLPDLPYPSVSKDYKFISSHLDYIQNCSNEMNPTEACLMLIRILGQYASDKALIKEEMHDEVKTSLLSFTEQTCFNLERTALACTSVNTLFYYQLARFLIAVCNDFDAYFVFSSKAIAESENNYMKLQLYVDLALNSRGRKLAEYVTKVDPQSANQLIENYFNGMLKMLEVVKKFHVSIEQLAAEQKKYTEDDKSSIFTLSSFINRGKDLDTLLCRIYSQTINVLDGFRLNGKRVYSPFILSISEEFFEVYDKCGEGESYAENAAHVCNEILMIH